jgi:hypothetical protein
MLKLKTIPPIVDAAAAAGYQRPAQTRRAKKAYPKAVFRTPTAKNRTKDVARKPDIRATPRTG